MWEDNSREVREQPFFYSLYFLEYSRGLNYRPTLSGWFWSACVLETYLYFLCFTQASFTFTPFFLCFCCALFLSLSPSASLLFLPVFVLRFLFRASFFYHTTSCASFFRSCVSVLSCGAVLPSNGSSNQNRCDVEHSSMNEFDNSHL